MPASLRANEQFVDIDVLDNGRVMCSVWAEPVETGKRGEVFEAFIVAHLGIPYILNGQSHLPFIILHLAHLRLRMQDVFEC